MGVPPGSMVPVTSTNVIFFQDSFWAMMLPPGIPVPVSDIWRGYWTQRLLLDVGGNVAYYLPFTFQKQKANQPMEGFQSESQLYARSGELIQFLLTWDSNKTESLFDRALELSFSIAFEKFWSDSDARFTFAWLCDLISIGYKPLYYRHFTKKKKWKELVKCCKTKRLLFVDHNLWSRVSHLPI